MNRNGEKNSIIKNSIYKILIVLVLITTIFSYIPINSIVKAATSSTRITNVVVEKAIECHKYVREHGYTYGGGYSIPDGIYSSSVVDCSAYVSWVLYSIGCESFHTYQETEFVANCSAGAHPELEEVPNKNDVQPGDILVYRPYGGSSGHVELAAQVEDGQVIRVYNCGSDDSISSAGTTEYPETSFPSRNIHDYSEHKIYRVKNVSSQAVSVSSDGDEDEKIPALVPYLVNSVISKYAQTAINGGGANSGTSRGGRIANYAESGDGWDSVTEVHYPNGVTRKYRNYKQGGGSYAGDHYWDGTLASDACGPSSIAIVLSGYGYDSDPGDVVDTMHSVFGTDSSDSFENLRQPLKHISNIEAEDHYTSGEIDIIRQSFNNARPVVVNAPGHYIVLLGEDSNGKLIVSDPANKFYHSEGGEAWAGQGPDTLEEFVNQGYITCGYILITSDEGADSSTTSGNTTSSTNSTSNNTATNSTNTTTNTNNRANNTSNNTSNTNNTNSTSNPNATINNNPQGTGEASIETCPADNGGYDAIFTSGTTGRQFKLFRQNLDGWNERYPITQFPGVWESGWRSECGTVSVMTIGSGYSSDVSFEDVVSKLEASGGESSLDGWIHDYTGQNLNWSYSYSKDEIANQLSNGCVALLHSTSSLVSSSGTHYMSILDIKSDKSEVYLSNPWQGSDYQGWITFDKLETIFESIAFITNDGSAVSYSSGGQASESSSSSSSKQLSNPTFSNNIIENDHGGYKLNIDLDSEVDRIIRKLKQKDFELEDYLAVAEQKEYFKNILKACIVVQYPDLRAAKEIAKNEPTDEIQGCIRVKRYTDTDTVGFSNSLSNIKDEEDEGIYLSYMPYNQFNELVKNSDTSALNYFSLDKSNNLVYAGWETLDANVSIEQIGGEADPNPDAAPGPRIQPYAKLLLKSASYLNQITNYSVPFNLFWSLLVYSGDEDFVNDFAKLVIDTDIVIGCFDATTTKVTTYTNTYDKHVITEDTIYVDNRNIGESTAVEKIYTYQVTEVQTIKTDNPSLKIKSADTWTAVYNMDYELLYKESSSDSEADLEDETISRDYGQIREDDEIEERLDENEGARKQFEDERERLRNEAHLYNQENFSSRYEVLNYFINNVYSFSGKSAELIKVEDVQNFIINMIIDEHSNEYIRNEFNDNDTIKECAEQINALDARSDAANAVIKMVEEAKENKDSRGSLWDRLTNNGNDTRKNKVLEYDISAIAYADYETREDQKEDIKTDTSTPEVQEKTTSKNQNVRFKDDPHANENSFVKLLYYSKHAGDNLKLIMDWFMDSLKNTSAIADLEDILKYLFQCTYHTDYGITEEDVNALLDFFDPKKMSVSMSKVSGTSTLQSADTNGIYNYLIGQGFTNAGAAGAMGNMEAESGFIPDSVESWYLYGEEYRVEYTRKVDSKEISKDDFVYNGPNGGGYGLVGFTWWEIKKELYENTVEKGRSIADMEGQLECIIKWIKERIPDLYNTLTTSNDLYTCTNEFLTEYERPAYPNIEERYSFAQKYYK